MLKEKKFKLKNIYSGKKLFIPVKFQPHVQKRFQSHV